MREEGPPQAGLESMPTPAVALPEGTLLLDGRFRLGRLLGRGGMGFVYLAEQVSLGRPVAIKVLRSDVAAQPGFAERFRREALLLSSVEDPAVVRVIDYGTHELLACLVMEYVEGETLEAVLQREAPLSVARVEALATQLAQGLAAIHARGIVHRDLKPDNVVLTRTVDGREQARLLDFGIARLATPETASAVTQAGMVLGTPEYVSPEQAMGQPLDARSDVYALGVILFRALTGQHPFPGPSPREFLAQHIHQAPPALLDLAPQLRAFPSLVAAVTAAMAKEPAARPQSAVAFVEALTAPVVPLAREAVAPPRPVALSRFRWPLLGGLVGLLALVGLWLSWANEPARKARRLVDSGRGSEALQVLEELGEAGQGWPMKQLRATALHQVGRHEEEWRLLGAVPEGEALEPLALEALADDFGRAEGPRLRKLLAGLPRAQALPTLQALATGADGRWAQWGALRFVDLEHAGQGLPLVELYVRALEHRDCGVRRTAARRLVDLRSADAVPPLEALKAQPRKKGEEDCGQAAAEAALQKLSRELP